MHSHLSKSSLNQNIEDLKYIKDSKCRTFVFPCVLLLQRSINLPPLPGYTGILALFYKHNKSAEFVVLCARSPLSHRPERNICSFVYEVSIQNDFQYFLLFFIPLILSSVWFFHQFSCVKPKCSPDKRSFWWQKELQKRLICTREVFCGLNILFFLPYLWIWDEWMISSFTNEDPWLSIKKNNWYGGGGG